MAIVRVFGAAAVNPDEWLRNFLATNGPTRASVLLAEARSEGLNKNQIYAAAKRLRVVQVSSGFPRTSHWQLPTQPTTNHHRSILNAHKETHMDNRQITDLIVAAIGIETQLARIAAHLAEIADNTRKAN